MTDRRGHKPHLMSKRTLYITIGIAVVISFGLGFLPGPWRGLALAPILLFVPFVYQAIRYNRWLNR